MDFYTKHSGILLAVDSIIFGFNEKETSKKGAFYYRFNKEKYKELLQKGLNFEI